jgi:hypothetical protein
LRERILKANEGESPRAVRSWVTIANPFAFGIEFQGTIRLPEHGTAVGKSGAIGHIEPAPLGRLEQSLKQHLRSAANRGHEACDGFLDLVRATHAPAAQHNNVLDVRRLGILLWHGLNFPNLAD